MRKRITAKQIIVWSTSQIKPGQRPMDKRYKDGVDTGRFSTNRIPLPLKPLSELQIPAIDDDIPKQRLRQKQNSRHNRGKTNFQ